MKKVVIMQGVSGSGKSTYVGQNLSTAVVVSADQFFMNDGQYNFDPSKLSEAHQFCWRQFLLAIQEGAELIVVDNTNTTVCEISPYVLPAESFGYQVEVITLEIDVRVAIERNVHSVPENVIRAQDRRMCDSWKRMPPWWKRMIHRDH